MRDLLLGREAPDWDFATSAHPPETTRVLQGWADRRYFVGVRFGTVGARKDGHLLEITTYREEVYVEEHRKPAVTLRRRRLETDLSRRDFTINAMAVRLPGRDVRRSLRRRGGSRARSLDTPLDPDGRRSPTIHSGWCGRRGSSRSSGSTRAPTRGRGDDRDGGRLEIVSAERIRDELDRLLVADAAAAGLDVLVETGLADVFLPEVAGAAARARPRAQAQGRARATRTRWSAEPSPTCVLRLAGAAPRHRQAGDATDHGRRRVVPPPRGRRCPDGARTARGAAVPERGHRRRVHADRAAPAVPRLRRGVDRHRRPSLRARRRSPARRSQPAHARRRHDPQREARRAVPRACRTSSRSGSRCSPRPENLEAMRPPLDGRPGDGASRPRTGTGRRGGARPPDGASGSTAGRSREDEAYALLDPWAKERGLGVVTPAAGRRARARRRLRGWRSTVAQVDPARGLSAARGRGARVDAGSRSTTCPPRRRARSRRSSAPTSSRGSTRCSARCSRDRPRRSARTRTRCSALVLVGERRDRHRAGAPRQADPRPA